MKSVRIATMDEKAEMKKHFDEYLRELSQFDPSIKFDKNGTPIYKWFDYYWREDGRYPFLLSVDNQFAGLALVRQVGQQRYEIAEFYVAPEFRKDNNALDFATIITRRFGGEFSFSTRKENHRAVRFWDKFVEKFPYSHFTQEGDLKEWSIQTESAKDLE